MKLMPNIPFPKTRYLGSKRKLIGPLYDVFQSLEFETALDPFSGTGVVSYLLKQMGVSVVSSDTMAFNVAAAQALVVNQQEHISAEIDRLLNRVSQSNVSHGFIETTFDGLFFLPDENRFIDRYLDALQAVKGVQRDMAVYCLGQAALAKRPYNLFHRANLNMRQRDVARSFGNKTTWDTPFEALIRRFATEVDRAVFWSDTPCRAVRSDVLEVDALDVDLVYLDPPYVSANGKGVDYIDYYHFLEGLTEPERWMSRVLHRYKHKPLMGKGENPWCDPKRVSAVFRKTIERFSKAILVISYRSDGIPSIEQLVGYLESVGKRVKTVDVGKYTYALSKNRRSKEIILVGR